jgi:hypothetical protein
MCMHALHTVEKRIVKTATLEGGRCYFDTSPLRDPRGCLLLGILDLAAIRGVFIREKRSEPWGVHLPIGCAVLIGLQVVDRLP